MPLGVFSDSPKATQVGRTGVRAGIQSSHPKSSTRPYPDLLPGCHIPPGSSVLGPVRSTWIPMSPSRHL